MTSLVFKSKTVWKIKHRGGTTPCHVYTLLCLNSVSAKHHLLNLKDFTCFAKFDIEAPIILKGYSYLNNYSVYDALICIQSFITFTKNLLNVYCLVCIILLDSNSDFFLRL